MRSTWHSATAVPGSPRCTRILPQRNGRGRCSLGSGLTKKVKLFRSRSIYTTFRASSSSSSMVTTKPPEMCVIVDEENNVVGAATRYETVSKRLLGRGSYVLVFNTAGQLFVTQRSIKKDCYPGCLDVTISGVVNQGEEYTDTAVRELQEELSIPITESSHKLRQLFMFPYQDDTCHVWGCASKLVWDGPVAFQDAEVEWGNFLDLKDLQQQLELDQQQFTPVGRHILGLYLEHQHHINGHAC